MERFLEEARILAKLQNTPNIVSVQNYFRENNTAYFVMEYVNGTSLKAYLAAHGEKSFLRRSIENPAAGYERARFCPLHAAFTPGYQPGQHLPDRRR